MKISIIIPAHNAELWISESLNSCLRQSLAPLEIIVVDDGSIDKTYSVVSDYAERNGNIVRTIRTENKGPSAARNIGLEVSKGEYVVFLDADDMLTEGALHALSTIALKTGADAVFAAHYDLDQASGTEVPIRRNLVYCDGYANVARFLWPVDAVLLKKTDTRWNENRFIWEVMEYLLDFLAADHHGVFIPFIAAMVRHHTQPGRISARFDHHDPRITGTFFSECKTKLEKSGKLNVERASALDFHLLRNAYALLKAGNSTEADMLFDRINWADVCDYDWCKVGSLGWAGHWAGRRLGTRGVYYINRILQRA
jgi:glycosyltransferase involved in cell wall biosynthesis